MKVLAYQNLSKFDERAYVLESVDARCGDAMREYANEDEEVARIVDQEQFNRVLAAIS